MSNEAIILIKTLLGFFMIIFLFAAVICAVLFAFWIWMLIDCLKRNFGKGNDKLVWVLVIIFLPILGAAIYYFAVRAKDKK